MAMHDDVPKAAESSRAALKLSIRPEQLEKTPPCQAGCPNSGDIRSWLGIIAQHDKLGLTLEAAYDRAWAIVAERNPFPATLGRICPHPCESNCTRSDKDGPVAINALERFIGDWGLRRGLILPTPGVQSRSETVGVIGAGPAGLSFAYQMARRGYPVTVYERDREPGGMLRYDVPDFRLPEGVLAAEIERIVNIGIDLQLVTEVGSDVTLDQLRGRHDVLFIGMGAQHSRRLGIPGEDGPGVWPGLDYLRLRKLGNDVDVGGRIAVIGGGNTAIDAARMARRAGADVTIIYRRTRAEMPAIAEEIDDALTEGIEIEFLAAPVEIIRDGDAVRALSLQKMELGKPDQSGRRRPLPVAGSEERVEFGAVIVAVSQELDRRALGQVRTSHGQIETDATGKLASHVWAGGDDLGPGIAALATAQGRQAAEAAHAELLGLSVADGRPEEPVSPDQIKAGYYEQQGPLDPPRRPKEEWLRRPDDEIDRTIDSEQALQEATRCFSCGNCFGCQQCWMYCNAGSFLRLSQASPGNYFTLNMDACEGCGKCIEVCPSGFLSVRR
ncbi:MAG: FAD-dependent oxidoreductase [Gammaproteobacteria bacterium]|nr:FAD-dependent oxidoreductase [Gammaproteobacteria bacterium]